MPLLNVVKPAEAEGKVKEVYDVIQSVAGMVPKPMQMMSINPELLNIQGQILRYFLGNQNLSEPLTAHIRYLVAEHFNYQYCIDFNANILTMFGNLTEEELEAARQDPAQAKLDEKDRAMLGFVVKAIKQPESVEKADVEKLQGFGWTDVDIFDALYHGSGMVVAGIMFKALKMDED